MIRICEEEEKKETDVDVYFQEYWQEDLQSISLDDVN